MPSYLAQAFFLEDFSAVHMQDFYKGGSDIYFWNSCEQVQIHRDEKEDGSQ